MSHNISVLIDQFVAIYEPLVELQAQLSHAIQESVDYPFWSFFSDRESVANFVSLLDYEDADNSDSTKTLPALVALSIDSCKLIPLINEKRTELAIFLRVLDEDRRTSPYAGVTLSKFLLSRLHLGRLNRRALVRRYIELDCMPTSVRYLWANTRSIRKMTAKKAVQSATNLMLEPGSKQRLLALSLERSLLDNLDPEETVARVNHDAPQPRASMVLKGKRVMGKTAMMPIFYPWEKGESEPVLVPLTEFKQDGQRLKRSDQILDDKPFAPISKIHRYKTISKIS